jgi:hypothetical protein
VDLIVTAALAELSGAAEPAGQVRYQSETGKRQATSTSFGKEHWQLATSGKEQWQLAARMRNASFSWARQMG